jgi:hypothetical protein
MKQRYAATRWIDSIGDMNVRFLQALELYISFHARDDGINMLDDRWQPSRLHLDVKSVRS